MLFKLIKLLYMGVNDYIVARFRLNCKQKAESKQVTSKTLK